MFPGDESAVRQEERTMGFFDFVKGVGKKLMQAAVKVADQEKLPVYLDCHGDRNVAIYTKYGFEAKQELTTTTKKGDRCGIGYRGMMRPYGQ